MSGACLERAGGGSHPTNQFPPSSLEWGAWCVVNRRPRCLRWTQKETFCCVSLLNVPSEQITALELVADTMTRSMTGPLRYRGVPYDTAAHEQTSDRPVEHVYRGRAYLAPLRHPPAPTEPTAELRYRGRRYLSHRGQADKG